MERRDTKTQLIRLGTRLFLAKGYSDTGLQEVLAASGVPKGSFYHHFKTKKDFGLQTLEFYAQEMTLTLTNQLSDTTQPPLDRLRGFFEFVFDEWKQRECRGGCLLGILGQELADVDEDFRAVVNRTLDHWSQQIALCLAEARGRGELPGDSDPRTLAETLLDGYEGASLRMRLEHHDGALRRFLDYTFDRLLT